MPFFTVVIPSYNRYKLLKRAIDSVLSQTHRDYELVMVDDGSTDETPLIKSDYNNSIIYIKQANSGVSSARNTGIKNSDSPYIAFLDSDDLWLPGKLEDQYRFIKENPSFLISQTEEIWIRNGQHVNPMQKHRKKEGEIFLNSLELCMISPSSVVIKRELFEKYGIFDEELPVCEDYDMWLRITCFEKAGLIKRKLIKKFGGHDSQLSKKYWGMDRFRIYAILKLLKSRGKSIKPEYYYKARETAIAKSNILLNGALKRGNKEFAAYFNMLINSLEHESYNSINSAILLKG